jgi:hypothetical protein
MLFILFLTNLNTMVSHVEVTVFKFVKNKINSIFLKIVFFKNFEFLAFGFFGLLMDVHGRLKTLMDAWTLMDAHGRSWTIVDHHGRSWTIVDDRGRSWTIVDVLGRSRTLEKFGHATVTFTLPNHKKNC